MKKNLLFTFLTVSLVSAAQVNLTSSLSACYALNGNVTDPINTLTGAAYSVTTVSDRNNNAGAAIEFAGNASSYIELPGNPLLQSTVAVSFSGWVNATAFQANDFLVFTKNNTTSSFAAYSLMLHNNQGYKFRVYKESGSPNYAESTTLLSLNTWYHVAFTIDNTSLMIYVNGVLEGTAPSTTAFDYDVNGKNVILGGSNELNYNKPFKGKMDNVRFYRRVLNAAEVLALYQQDPSCIDATGLADLTTDQLYSIFPNPANDVLQLDLKTNNTSKATVYSASGQLVKNFPLSEGTNRLSIEDLSPGMYVLVLDGVNEKKTFVKN